MPQPQLSRMGGEQCLALLQGYSRGCWSSLGGCRDPPGGTQLQDQLSKQMPWSRITSPCSSSLRWGGQGLTLWFLSQQHLPQPKCPAGLYERYRVITNNGLSTAEGLGCTPRALESTQGGWAIDDEPFHRHGRAILGGMCSMPWGRCFPMPQQQGWGWQGVPR